MDFFKDKFPSSSLLFLLPILFSFGLFTLLPLFGCQSNEGGTSGSLKILYTSEVGGRIDPCG